MNSLWNAIKDWYDLFSGRAQTRAFIEAWRRQIKADHIARGFPTDLEGYRAKFRRNLLGYWSTNPGFGPFPITQWQFFEDGTALELHLAGSGNETTHYQWRELDDFAIELLWGATESDEIEEPDMEADEDEFEEERTPTWFRVTYDFKVEGKSIVLFQTPENEFFKFGLSGDYLEFQGDYLKEKREEK